MTETTRVVRLLGFSFATWFATSIVLGCIAASGDELDELVDEIDPPVAVAMAALKTYNDVGGDKNKRLVCGAASEAANVACPCVIC